MRDYRLIERAKFMLRQPTAPQQRLWLELRAKRFGGAKFSRQVVVGSYIVDFACRRSTMLAIEVDGETHASRTRYDEERTSFLIGVGYRVLRFSNQDVTRNLDGVLHAIEDALPLAPALSPEGEREKG